MLYKGFNVNDDKIDDYVEKLGISIDEACTLILEESGKLKETEEEKKAMDIKTPRHYEKTTSKRKATNKERKVDEIKGLLLANVKALIEEMGATETAIKTETELKFNYEGGSYTFKLTKHRPPKK